MSRRRDLPRPPAWGSLQNKIAVVESVRRRAEEKTAEKTERKRARAERTAVRLFEEAEYSERVARREAAARAVGSKGASS